MSKWFPIFIFVLLIVSGFGGRKRKEDKTKCPKVKAIRNFNLEEMLGQWYVMEYYASSEEALAYRCMQADFAMSSLDVITMNFTYSFTDDPLNEQLNGNITWIIPNPVEPAHWTHAEDTYEGVYNTYVLDSDYISWALLLHCAEKSKVPRSISGRVLPHHGSSVRLGTDVRKLPYNVDDYQRCAIIRRFLYLSSFIMSREPTLGINVISYLRDKLPRYDIDLSYMFDMSQNDCNATDLVENIPPSVLANMNRPVELGDRRHPMKHVHG